MTLIIAVFLVGAALLILLLHLFNRNVNRHLDGFSRTTQEIRRYIGEE